jgi:hypothetical protein
LFASSARSCAALACSTGAIYVGHAGALQLICASLGAAEWSKHHAVWRRLLRLSLCLPKRDGGVIHVRTLAVHLGRVHPVHAGFHVTQCSHARPHLQTGPSTAQHMSGIQRYECMACAAGHVWLLLCWCWQHHHACWWPAWWTEVPSPCKGLLHKLHVEVDSGPCPCGHTGVHFYQVRARTRFVSASPSARRAMAAGSISPLSGCSPMAVAAPVRPKCVWAITATSPTGSCSGPTHCCCAIRPAGGTEQVNCQAS